jgi:hypothetical protein
MEMKKSLAKKMQRLKKTLLAQGLGPRVPAPMETGGIDPVVMATDVE